MPTDTWPGRITTPAATHLPCRSTTIVTPTPAPERPVRVAAAVAVDAARSVRDAGAAAASVVRGGAAVGDVTAEEDAAEVGPCRAVGAAVCAVGATAACERGERSATGVVEGVTVGTAVGCTADGASVAGGISTAAVGAGRFPRPTSCRPGTRPDPSTAIAPATATPAPIPPSRRRTAAGECAHPPVPPPAAGCTGCGAGWAECAVDRSIGAVVG